MNRPYVICHMASTVDGRIIAENWGDDEQTKAFGDIYEKCHNNFDSQAWMVGRVTMEKDFTEGKEPEPVMPAKPILREPFVGDKEATSFAIAVDPKGKLGWDDNEVSGDHIIEILTEEVSDSYLNYLRQKGISYLFAGREALDFNSALYQLAELFSIRTIMLEGGGHINGSLLNDGLIDELSLLVLPVADGSPKSPTTFDVSDYLQKRSSSLLQLKGVKQLENDVVWLQYRFLR